VIELERTPRTEIRSWVAMAVVALGAPSQTRKRRSLAPRYVLLCHKLWRSCRKAVAARFSARLVPRRTTVSAVIRLSGHITGLKQNRPRWGGEQPAFSPRLLSRVYGFYSR